MRLRFLFLYILVSWGVLSHAMEPDSISSAQDSIVKPWEQRAREQIDSLLYGDMFRTSQIGLLVWDLEADSALYAWNERQTMRPASTMKLLTAITALDRLGGGHKLTTTLSMEGHLTDSILHGYLTVKGNMDPMFDYDDLTAFVESVRQLNIDTIRGGIREDRSMKDKDLLGEGWCWDDDNPVLSPLVYGRKDQLIERLAQELRAAGIAVVPADSVCVEDSSKKGKKEDKTLCKRWHTIDQVLVRMMKESDNLYAEALFYQLSKQGSKPATAKQSAAIVKQLISKAGLSPTRYRIADGSGLSLYNYVSAELMVTLLRYAYKNDQIYSHLLPTLPVAGMDGTLKKRMQGTTAEGNVKAKTGTLSAVITLAGYATAPNGHKLCFAIMNQGILNGNAARDFQDKVCIALCGE